MQPKNKHLCLICKGGRMLCGLPTCPLLQKVSIHDPLKEKFLKLSKDMFGPAPSIFVGWHNYPNVLVGPMTSLESEDTKAEKLDNPGTWYGSNYPDIIEMRSMLVRSKNPQNIFSRSRFVSDTQELALSVRPTDVETSFKKKPTYRISFSSMSQPMGPSGDIEKIRIAGNTKIPRKVDGIISDDLKARESAFELYNNNFDVYYLTSVLSSGVLGMKQGRKLVPTRWSITAVDDLIGKELLKKIREYPEIRDITVYSNEYLHNHFEILLIPGKWEFEQFEAWAPKTFWMQEQEAGSMPAIVEEHEPFQGRTGYAMKEGGGYYAGRIGVIEALEGMRKQARAVVFREISEGYIMPVGVWEVRENVRHAFKNPPMKFATLKEALRHINSKLGLPIKEYLKRSEILKQRRLNEWS